MLASSSFVHAAPLSSAPPSIPSSPSSQSGAPTVDESKPTVPEDREGKKCICICWGREGLTQVSGWLWFVTQLLSSLVSPPQVPTSQSALTHTPHRKTSTSSLSVTCHPLLQLAVPPLQMANNSLLLPYPRLTLTRPLFPSPKMAGQLPPTMLTPPLLLLQVRRSVCLSA